MRAILMQAIVTDPDINLDGVDEDAFFAVDVDTPQVRPFVQLRWGTNNPGLDVVTRRFLTIWVHDEPGDYSRIDRIVFRLRQILPLLEGTVNGSQSILAVEWTGDSEDLTDDGHQTIARTASFELVGSGQ